MYVQRDKGEKRAGGGGERKGGEGVKREREEREGEEV